MAREYTGKSINCIVRLNKIVFTKRNFNIISFSVIKNLTQDEIIKDRFGKITVSGVFNMDKIEEGVQYILSADEVKHEKYGLQYQVTAFKTNYPLVNEEDIKCFLSNIMTEKQFKNYCEAFKDELLLPLKNNDVELIVEKVSGFGATKAIKLIEKYNNNEEDAYILAKMTKFELTANDLKKLKHTYGNLENAFKTIQENPYKLIRDIKGYGFKKADSIATMGGMKKYDIRRTQGFVEAYLNHIANQGSTKVDLGDVCEEIYNELGEEYPDDSIINGLKGLENEKVIWVSEDRNIIALNYYRDMELNLAKKIKEMSTSKNNFVYDNWLEKIRNLEETQGWKFGKDQLEGIKMGLDNNFLVITGKAGSGKSSLVSGILEVLGEDYNYVCCALSGKASYNIANMTGCQAFTMHKMMNMANKANGYIEADVIIIDEVGMCDVALLLKFFNYVKSGTKVIMLGDTAQLPPIGIGSFLQDILATRVVPSVALTKIRRQGAKSGIISCGAIISDGVQLEKRGFAGKENFGELEDFHLDLYTDKALTKTNMIKQYKELINRGVSAEDILMLSPNVNRGGSSCLSINNEIHKLLINEKAKGVKSIVLGAKDKQYTISTGDIILNTSNSYKTATENDELAPIYNGETAKVIDIKSDCMIADFGKKGRVVIPEGHYKNIQLGYCLTVHKAQGLGVDYVIMGLDYSSYMLLNRELLYTGLTRAKKECWVFAETNAFYHSIKTSGLQKRDTFLEQFLQEEFKNKE